MSTIALSSTTARPSKGLVIALWAVQILLALAFGMAGIMKSTAPIEELAKNMPWVARSSPELVRFIGISEFLGALGLLLPALTRIKPILTPIAALGLATIMVLAIGSHALNNEAPVIGFNVVLGGLAGFVAWGRLKKAPITPRA